jgi:hypothetical protein
VGVESLPPGASFSRTAGFDPPPNLPPARGQELGGAGSTNATRRPRQRGDQQVHRTATKGGDHPRGRCRLEAAGCLKLPCKLPQIPSRRKGSRPLMVTLFTLTSVLTAALLFLVQPMVAHMVLPAYGGSP